MEDGVSNAGSSRETRTDRFYHTKRARQYVELHDQVEMSVNLLDSLEGFLSTFQTDLTAVASQISNLQDRSKDIDDKLKARRKIEKPLSSLLADLCISPTVATTILDTDVGDNWLSAIPELERRLNALNTRKRVKAARDLFEVAEGLRIVAATKIRTFFLSLLSPIKTSMTTNMQVLQSSVMVKYRSLYEFLQSQAEDVAREIQRSYVAASRVYYETGFRRYTRSLGWIKARTTEKQESTLGNTDANAEFPVEENRLVYAKIDGPAVVQAYIAENKTHKEPLEALLRSMLLVLMDNATAEYTFISTFFAQPSRKTDLSMTDPTNPPFTPIRPLITTIAIHEPSPRRDRFSNLPMDHRDSLSRIASNATESGERDRQKEELNVFASTWKQVMEPTLSYCETFAKSALDPAPSAVVLLIMIRMIENTLGEVQTRGCGPLESWLFGLRMQFWPIFQKIMTEHILSLVKLTESSASSGYFRKPTGPSDGVLKAIANRYSNMFSSFTILTGTEEETMIFSNLMRLRHELTNLITIQSKRIADPLKSATFLSSMYEALLQALSRNHQCMTHPKAQTELAYWRGREEESRRRISSTTQQAR